MRRHRPGEARSAVFARQIPAFNVFMTTMIQ
jgi:hypothetical protein